MRLTRAIGGGFEADGTGRAVGVKGGGVGGWGGRALAQTLHFDFELRPGGKSPPPPHTHTHTHRQTEI